MVSAAKDKSQRNHSARKGTHAVRERASLVSYDTGYVWLTWFAANVEATMTTCLTWSVRPGTRYDFAILQRMIYEALYWQPDAEREPFDFVIAHPEIALYVDGWGRAGDGAVIARRDSDGQAIGAAWYRLFSEDAPGYGFVRASIPEVAIAVDDGYRGRGIGRALMENLLELARREGICCLSLSVEHANSRAHHLYTSLGFRRVGGDDHNDTMVIDLSGCDS